MSDGGELVAKCQALTRRGTPCGQKTVAGYPFCINHIKYGTVSKTHDRYSSVTPNAFSTHYQHQLSDDNPKDLTEELALLRGSLRSHYNKMQDREANGEETMTIADLAITMQMVDHISRLAERQAKVSPDRVVTTQEVITIITSIIDVINEHIPADNMELRGKIVEGINRCATELISTSKEYTPGSNQI